MVSNCMLISILSMSVESQEMSCAEAVDALAPQTGDLKAVTALSVSVLCSQLVLLRCY